jgi:D-alanyl-D-alanine carboxypeptidase (penicillin-binding protein 5/6)
MTNARHARTPTHRRPRLLLAGLLAVVAAVAVVDHHSAPSPASQAATPPTGVLRADRRLARDEAGPTSVSRADGDAVPAAVWPVDGQAAFIRSGQSEIHAGPRQHPAPIASVAKVMTAYVVLRDHPLRPGEDGPVITLTAADVADTAARSAHHESVVPIEAGERLTERQALEALLVPSANNVAAVLARWDAGSDDRFIARMSAAARSLGMTHTRYTDPSGYDAGTVSTAADQVRVVARAMRSPVFAAIVAMPSVTLPVAGTVHTTNALLGHDGFVGVKTGSDDAAGGCFAFRAIRRVDGEATAITGVVLGQPGSDQIAAGLTAAAAMVDRITGRRVRPHHLRPGAPPPAGV